MNLTADSLPVVRKTFLAVGYHAAVVVCILQLDLHHQFSPSDGAGFTAILIQFDRLLVWSSASLMM